MSRKRAAFVATHLLGKVIRTNAEISLITLMLTAARVRAMLLARARWLGCFPLSGIAAIDLRASIRILHCVLSIENEGAMDDAWWMPAPGGAIRAATGNGAPQV